MINHQNRRLFLAGGALLPAALLTTTSTAAETTEPTPADIGFCRDMTVHPMQALTMCQRVLGRDTGGPVQAAAAAVLQNQAMEIAQMRAPYRWRHDGK